MRRTVLVLTLLALATLVFAQTQTAKPDSKLAFDEPGQSVAFAMSTTFNVYVDVGTPVPLTGVVCVVSVAPAPSGTTCTANLPSMGAGAHSLTLTQLSNGAESLKSIAFPLTYVPVGIPQNPRLVPASMLMWARRYR